MILKIIKEVNETIQVIANIKLRLESVGGPVAVTPAGKEMITKAHRSLSVLSNHIADIKKILILGSPSKRRTTIEDEGYIDDEGYKGEKAYYYLHTSGSVIRKTTFVVDSLGAEEYFSGGFVVEYWLITNNKEYEEMMEEVKQMGKK